MITNPHHKEALTRAESHLAQAVKDLRERMPEDFVASNLTSALKALGEITGEAASEELLETIFSRFCVGK